MTARNVLQKNLDRGIYGAECDYDALTTLIHAMPEFVEDDIAHKFVRMAERWATFAPGYYRPDWMTNDEYYNSLKN